MENKKNFNKEVVLNKEVDNSINGEIEYLNNNKDIENYRKDKRVLLFLLESRNIKDSNLLRKLYLEKYNLSNKSNEYNNRVIERFFGVDSKYSNEKKELKIKLLKGELNKVNINYNNLIEYKKEVNNKLKSKKNILSMSYNF